MLQTINRICFALVVLLAPFERMIPLADGGSLSLAVLVIPLWIVLNIPALPRYLEWSLSGPNRVLILTFSLFIAWTAFGLLVEDASLIEYAKSTIQYVCYFTPILFLHGNGFTRTYIDRICKAAAMFLVLYSLIDIGTWLTGKSPFFLGDIQLWGAPVAKWWEGFRLYGVFSEPANLGNYCSFLVAYFLFEQQSRRRLMYLSVLIPVVLLTMSLSAYMALFAIVGTWLALSRQSLVAVSFSLILLVPTTFWIGASVFPDATERLASRIIELPEIVYEVIETGTVSGTGSTRYRVYSNLLFLEMPMDKMLWGLSYDGTDEFAETSALGSAKITSVVSFLILTSGYVGFALFLCFLTSVFLRCRGIYRIVFITQMLYLFASGNLIKSSFWIPLYFCILCSDVLEVSWWQLRAAWDERSRRGGVEHAISS